VQSIKTVIECIMASRYFVGSSAPLSATFHRASDDCNAVVIAGPNASGKSFMVRLIAAWLQNKEVPKVEPIQVSMRYRAGNDVYGPQRVMMFGSEDDNSTGVNSVSGLMGAIRTSRGRDSSHYVLFDEPDIGLAEEYAIPAGRHIGQFTADKPEHCGGVALISHSKPLIRGFVDGLDQTPHFLHMDGELTFEEWLSTTGERSFEELQSLSSRSVERWRKINALQQASKRQ
jgi:energy-coupling factor transporter ATP-binding protein EcfA2